MKVTVWTRAESNLLEPREVVRKPKPLTYATRDNQAMTFQTVRTDDGQDNFKCRLYGSLNGGPYILLGHGYTHGGATDSFERGMSTFSHRYILTLYNRARKECGESAQLEAGK